MIFFEHLLDKIDIAILEGIVTFGDKEGKFSRDIINYYNEFKKAKNVIEKDNIINQYINNFNSFISTFKIARNIYENTRHKFVNYVFTEFLPSIEHKYFPLGIDKYSEEAKLLGLTKGKATSAFSKIAFIYKPNLYFPYDRTAKNAISDYLRVKGLNTIIIDGNYVNFSKTVYECFCKFDECYKIKKYISTKQFLSKFTVNKNILDKRINSFYDNCKFLNISDIDDFIYRRAFDKALMLYGQFNKNKLVVFSDNIVLS